MPRRAPPPDRLACEAALSPEQLTILRGQATALMIPEGRWHQVPGFAALWSTHAAVAQAAKFRAHRRGLSEDRAIALAAMRLGLETETVRSRLRRFYRHARGL